MRLELKPGAAEKVCCLLVACRVLKTTVWFVNKQVPKCKTHLQQILALAANVAVIICMGVKPRENATAVRRERAGEEGKAVNWRLSHLHSFCSTKGKK